MQKRTSKLRMSGLTAQLINRATDGAIDAKAVQDLADELAANGIALSSDGIEASIANPNFFVVGSKTGVFHLALFRKELLIELANKENKNHFVFMVNADSGETDFGFDISKIAPDVPEGSEYNFRYRGHVNELQDFIRGIHYEKTWIDEITPEKFSAIVDEQSLFETAFDILESKAHRIILAGG